VYDGLSISTLLHAGPCVLSLFVKATRRL